MLPPCYKRVWNNSWRWLSKQRKPSHTLLNATKLFTVVIFMNEVGSQMIHFTDTVLLGLASMGAAKRMWFYFWHCDNRYLSVPLSLEMGMSLDLIIDIVTGSKSVKSISDVCWLPRGKLAGGEFSAWSTWLILLNLMGYKMCRPDIPQCISLKFPDLHNNGCLRLTL